MFQDRPPNHGKKYDESDGVARFLLLSKSGGFVPLILAKIALIIPKLQHAPTPYYLKDQNRCCYHFVSNLDLTLIQVDCSIYHPKVAARKL